MFCEFRQWAGWLATSSLHPITHCKLRCSATLYKLISLLLKLLFLCVLYVLCLCLATFWSFYIVKCLDFTSDCNNELIVLWQACRHISHQVGLWVCGMCLSPLCLAALFYANKSGFGIHKDTDKKDFCVWSHSSSCQTGDLLKAQGNRKQCLLSSHVTPAPTAGQLRHVFEASQVPPDSALWVLANWDAFPPERNQCRWLQILFVGHSSGSAVHMPCHAAAGKYTTLKQLLLWKCSLSTMERVCKLLSLPVLGDGSAVDFMDMLSLLGLGEGGSCGQAYSQCLAPGDI